MSITISYLLPLFRRWSICSHLRFKWKPGSSACSLSSVKQFSWCWQQPPDHSAAPWPEHPRQHLQRSDASFITRALARRHSAWSSCAVSGSRSPWQWQRHPNNSWGPAPKTVLVRRLLFPLWPDALMHPSVRASIAPVPRKRTWFLMSETLNFGLLWCSDSEKKIKAAQNWGSS